MAAVSLAQSRLATGELEHAREQLLLCTQYFATAAATSSQANAMPLLMNNPPPIMESSTPFSLPVPTAASAEAAIATIQTPTPSSTATQINSSAASRLDLDAVQQHVYLLRLLYLTRTGEYRACKALLDEFVRWSAAHTTGTPRSLAANHVTTGLCFSLLVRLSYVCVFSCVPLEVLVTSRQSTTDINIGPRQPPNVTGGVLRICAYARCIALFSKMIFASFIYYYHFKLFFVIDAAWSYHRCAVDVHPHERRGSDAYVTLHHGRLESDRWQAGVCRRHS